MSRVCCKLDPAMLLPQAGSSTFARSHRTSCAVLSSVCRIPVSEVFLLKRLRLPLHVGPRRCSLW